MIESDVPQADGRLNVTFYPRYVQNNFKTEKEKRPIHERVDYVKVFVPGDQLNVIDTPVREDHKARFPKQWYQYKNTGESEQRLEGTPIELWPRVTPEIAESLKSMKYYTVEDIAGASDYQLQGMGMSAGMNPQAFRDQAKKFLALAKGEADNSNQSAEIARLKAEQAERDRQHQEELDALKATVTSILEKKKPGRKPKGDVNGEYAPVDAAGDSGDGAISPDLRRG